MEKCTLSPSLLLENPYTMLVTKLSKVISSWYPKSSTERAVFAEVSVSENNDWEILGLYNELLWENKEEESDETARWFYSHSWAQKNACRGLCASVWKALLSKKVWEAINILDYFSVSLPQTSKWIQLGLDLLCKILSFSLLYSHFIFWVHPYFSLITLIYFPLFPFTYCLLILLFSLSSTVLFALYSPPFLSPHHSLE